MITDIPTDVVCKYIIPNLGFVDAYNADAVRLFEVKTIKTKIDSDIVIQEFLGLCKIDLYDALKNSSISISDYDKTITDMKNDIAIKNTFSFDLKDISEENIRNTISIMRLLKMYACKLFASNDIDDNLMVYMSSILKRRFHRVYRKKFPKRFSDREFSESVHTNSWEIMNIDLYLLYERTFVYKYNPRSIQLKESIISKNLIMRDICEQPYPIKLLLYLTINHNSGYKPYIFYEFLRYINYFLENKTGQSIFENQALQRIVLQKIEEEYPPESYQFCPDYLLAEMENYLLRYFTNNP